MRQGVGKSASQRVSPIAQRIAAMSMCAAMIIITGCRQDMHNQPKFYPQRGTTFYADGRSVRPQVEDTVARGQLHEDSYFFTGMNGTVEGNTMPLPVNEALLKRGQEQYNVYCTACHSRVGNGQGMIVERGYRPAGNFHSDRLRNAPLGHFFAVISHGYGAMPDYSAQLNEEDRWAVVAYIRALQLSQNATQADVAPGQHAQPITDIEAAEGFSPQFVTEWPMPATENVYGTPNGDDNGIPGTASQPASKSASQPVSKPASPLTPATPAAPAKK